LEGVPTPGEETRTLTPAKETTEVKGDFTRFLFDPLKRYVGVLVQQGRVILDADWNELADRVKRRRRRRWPWSR
jgi:Family of unknown function (DUF6519)